MNKQVTIVITPRDRYSGLDDCINTLYSHTDEQLFELIVLNLGYPKKDWQPGVEALKSRTNASVVDFGRIIPVEAMRRVREIIKTPYVVFMDNDSRAMPNWLPPLLKSAEALEAAVIYPVTLERSGVDAGAAVRTHLFTTEIRVVDFEDVPYLIEHKTFRRAAEEALPQEPTESQAFELHCVMFNSAVLESLEIPSMTIREHLDIGMQLRARGLKLYVEPASKIMFDNLGTRANLSDLQYFNLRWNSKITKQSSDLFEKRWGYRYYSEQAIYNWAKRRRLFLIMRWAHLPIGLANFIDRAVAAIKRRIVPVWDPLPNPEEISTPLFDRYENGLPKQLDHSTS